MTNSSGSSTGDSSHDSGNTTTASLRDQRLVWFCSDLEFYSAKSAHVGGITTKQIELKTISKIKGREKK